MTRDDKLAIFKDSRIGSYGALGLMLAVALRAVLIVSLPTALLGPALVASGALGRLTILLVMAQVAPIVERASLAKDIAHKRDLKQLVIAVLLIAPFAPFMPLGSISVSLVICAVFAYIFSGALARVLGGSTGDCLGFAAYAGQLLTLLVFAANPL